MKRGGKGQLSVQQIAAVAGVSETLVRKKLNQGKTGREIIAEAVAREREAVNGLPTVPVAPINGHAGGAALSYSAAQAAKENWAAKLRELEYQQRSRQLLPLAYVRVWAMRFLVEGRDLLLNGRNELADQLAAETDPQKVAAILEGWTDRVMLRYFQLETLWGGGEPLDEGILQERFEAARLAVVKR
jgi:hypothetical protein